MADRFREAWHRMVSFITDRGRQTPLPGEAGLPKWAQAGKRRRAHVSRVVAMLEAWADEMGVTAAERRRWVRAGWLHDALRDAALPKGLSHGAAAADQAAAAGERDKGVLNAVRYHSVGYGGWDDVGKMLYLADYLEPGRGRKKQRAQLARRVAKDRDGVLREVLARQIRSRVRRGRAVDPHTAGFWNAVVGGPLPRR
jgi:HD superfamily phosphohydrolase YqeK